MYLHFSSWAFDKKQEGWYVFQAQISVVLGSHQDNPPTKPLRLQVTRDGPAQSTDKAPP